MCCDTRGVSRRTHTEYYVCERYCLRSVMTRAVAGDFADAGDSSITDDLKIA
ncbi:hypothetical protein HMPREF1577_01529 [Gardnerella pickettii JCP8017A]|uniref:Uncharacterized protein n=1 Tax=Gardnerella pickettii JCP8017A TaxID=1261062 RepID=T2PKJ2_9BIFI|nr:hypothetical protein HMPREF1577_01529 [Gardnerella pickettii JCP8017A]EPI58780.1 hypothetical protein HMPREF1578_01467 [Gardnerella pickettii JCP8017B]